MINNRVLDNNYATSPPRQYGQPGRAGHRHRGQRGRQYRSHKNEVRGHGSYGIAMYALTDVFPPEHKLNVEPNPDNNSSTTTP